MKRKNENKKNSWKELKAIREKIPSRKMEIKNYIISIAVSILTSVVVTLLFRLAVVLWLD